MGCNLANIAVKPVLLDKLSLICSKPLLHDTNLWFPISFSTRTLPSQAYAGHSSHSHTHIVLLQDTITYLHTQYMKLVHTRARIHGGPIGTNEQTATQATNYTFRRLSLICMFPHSDTGFRCVLYHLLHNRDDHTHGSLGFTGPRGLLQHWLEPFGFCYCCSWVRKGVEMFGVSRSGSRIARKKSQFKMVGVSRSGNRMARKKSQF